MIRRPYAELASHLYKHRTAGLQYAAYRGERLTGIGLAEVLDDTIGKHAIETARFERKESRVGTNEICCESELRHDRPSGENEPDVRINGGNLVTLPASGRGPTSPTAAHVQQAFPAIRLWQADFRYWVFSEFSDQMQYMYPLVAPNVICTAG
jgi:hypothetical protein